MSSKTIVLIIEDEPTISNIIATTLKTNNFKTLQCSSGKKALSMIPSHCPDVILLDLGLPDMDGLEVLKTVRSWSDIPILVVSARDKEVEKVQALDLGADDYITKPFGTSELLARIRTAIRHSSKKDTSSSNLNYTYKCNDLVIDFNKRKVTLDNEDIHLTQIEYKLVCLLAKSCGKVLTYEHIINKIWGPYALNDNQILRVNMANIRRKIEKNPADPQYIFTEVGVGYRMAEEEETSLA